jgi:plastocyanin
VSFPGPFEGAGQSSVFASPDELLVPSNNIPFPGRPGVNYANPQRNWPVPGPEVNGSVFRPGQLISSGNLASVPQTPGVEPIETFSLTFDTPGTYRYLCFFGGHPELMFGSVEVVGAQAAAVPSPAQIDAQAQEEMAAITERLERAKAERTRSALRDLGPNGTNVWYVGAGNNYFRINEDRIGIDEFFPKDLTVTSGDAVVWASTGFHAVTFNPSPIIAPLNLEAWLPDGTQVVLNNPEVYDPVKPTGVFDPTQYYVSGNLSQGQPVGTAWTLTFETPGTFEYYCAVHRDRGMTGSITVVPRS